MKFRFRRCEHDLLTDLLPSRLDLSYGSWIAGGAARCMWFNKPEHIASVASHHYRHDIDIFCASEQARDDVKSYIVKKWFNLVPTVHDPWEISLQAKPPYTNIMKTQNATTYIGCAHNDRHMNLQVINRLALSLDELFDSFDFINCHFATNGIWMVTTEQALDSWQQGIIQRNPRYSGDIKIARILKYCVYGLTPPRDMWKELVSKSLETRSQGWNHDYTA